jgi:hypothetical protein
MAGAGGRDATRGAGEPRGGQHLPPLCPGPLGRALAAPERTRGSDYRAVWRRLYRGLRASGRRRAVLGRIAGTLPAVQPSATPRADAAERVWALCGRTAAAVWSRDASDMRLPRRAAYMPSDEAGEVDGTAPDNRQAAAPDTAGGPGDPAAAQALAHPPAGSLAAQCAVGALALLWGAAQRRPAHGVPRDGQALLGSDAPPTESAVPADLAADGRPRGTLASYTAHLSPVSRATPVRHDPRQAPGAGVPHAGICAGGVG